MNSQTIFLKTRPLTRPKPKFYVYYDEWTGNITNVGNREYDHLNDPYIITDSSVAVDLMKGNVNPKKYIIADLVDGMTLMEKDDVLRIKKLENNLTVVSYAKPNVLADVNIIFYKSNWLIEVNLNEDTIYRLTGRRHNKKFNVSDNINDSNIVLYLTERNNPLILYETIEINPIDLINNGYVLVELDHLRTKTTPLDLSFYTRRIFRNYGLKFKETYDTVEYNSRKGHKKKYTQIRNKTPDWTTFSVIPSTEGWIIKSNFDNPHDEKLFRDISLFLFDDTPFGLLEKVKIPFEKIGKYQEFLVKTKVDPTKCYIMLGEETKKLSFKFEELENAKPSKHK